MRPEKGEKAGEIVRHTQSIETVPRKKGRDYCKFEVIALKKPANGQAVSKERVIAEI